MKRKTWLYLVFFVLLFGGFYAFLYATIDSSKSRLPVLNIVKPFSFERQDGQYITGKDVAGKVYAAEFFFTTCEGICPKMNRNMKKVFDQYKNEKDFLILSHTVDPETDIDEQFIHTQFFALVDKIGQVRGIYDGLKKDETEKLITDIKDLLNENPR